MSPFQINGFISSNPKARPPWNTSTVPKPWSLKGFKVRCGDGDVMEIAMKYPLPGLVNIQKTMENCNRNSGFNDLPTWNGDFQTAMLVYQRASLAKRFSRRWFNCFGVSGPIKNWFIIKFEVYSQTQMWTLGTSIGFVVQCWWMVWIGDRSNSNGLHTTKHGSEKWFLESTWKSYEVGSFCLSWFVVSMMFETGYIILYHIISQMLHVWNIYLQNWGICGVNVGKYSSTMVRIWAPSRWFIKLHCWSLTWWPVLSSEPVLCTSCTCILIA